MRLGVEVPDLVVDVTHLPHDRIDATEEGGLLIGAGVRNSDLAADRRVRALYPALAEALLAGASGQLRNLATTGGNLLQRTRCPYFQDVTKPCNKREPGTGCPAREGEHRNLAIIGHSEHCVATHPSDLAVALAAFDAIVRVIGPAGEREIPLVDFHRLPGDTPQQDTVLERDELIVAVELARPHCCRQLEVSQGARARIVLVRAGLGRRRRSTLSTTRFATFASHLGGSHTSRGARTPPRRRCVARLRARRLSGGRPTPS